MIGGGPTGSFLASKLANAGCDVCVFEEHEVIGLPVHCTGLLTSKITDYVEIKDEFLTNSINSVEIHSPSDKARIKSREFVVSRQKFDEYLHKNAESLGVKYYLGYKFKGYEKRGSSIRLFFETKTGVRHFDACRVIGSDGPLSKVNEEFKINSAGRFILGKQVIIKTVVKRKDCYGAFFGGDLSDFFGWTVPVDENHIKIGVGSTRHTLVNNKLRSLRKSLGIKGKIVETNAGLIPIYDPYKDVYKKIGDVSVYLMGDAAGFVKATSGGGIIPSFSAITECYKDIIRGEYPHLPITRRELLAHLGLRNVMNKLSDDDWDLIVNDLNDSGVRKAISRINRDNVLKLGIELIKNNPLLLKYLRFLPRII